MSESTPADFPRPDPQDLTAPDRVIIRQRKARPISPYTSRFEVEIHGLVDRKEVVQLLERRFPGFVIDDGMVICS